MKTLTDEKAESLNMMTAVQEEQVQGGLKSALQDSYGVVAASPTISDEESVSPWVITF